MLANCYDKYNQSLSQSGKKKKNNGVIGNHNLEELTAKEKTTLVLDTMRELRSVLNVSESSLGKLKH